MLHTHGDVEEVQDHYDIDTYIPTTVVEQGEQGKQPITEPPIVHQLRRSIR